MHKHTKTGKKSLQTQIPKQRHDKAKTTLAASTGTRLFWPHAMFFWQNHGQNALQNRQSHTRRRPFANAEQAIPGRKTAHIAAQNDPFQPERQAFALRRKRTNAQKALTCSHLRLHTHFGVFPPKVLTGQENAKIEQQKHNYTKCNRLTGATLKPGQQKPPQTARRLRHISINCT